MSDLSPEEAEILRRSIAMLPPKAPSGLSREGALAVQVRAVPDLSLDCRGQAVDLVLDRARESALRSSSQLSFPRGRARRSSHALVVDNYLEVLRDVIGQCRYDGRNDTVPSERAVSDLNLGDNRSTNTSGLNDAAPVYSCSSTVAERLGQGARPSKPWSRARERRSRFLEGETVAHLRPPPNSFNPPTFPADNAWSVRRPKAKGNDELQQVAEAQARLSIRKATR